MAQMLPTKGGYTLLPTSLVNQGARLLPTSLANQGAQLIDPSVAGTLAGTQYDQAIADAKASLAQQQQDNEQMLANVGNWYGQVLGAQGQAAQRDSAVNQAAQSAEGQNNAAILASLGGGANAAAPAVAAAGQNDLGTLSALGSIEDQYNADMVPLLKLGQAGASASQQAANARLLSAALQNVQDLTAQKGATQAQDEYNILNQNNQIRDAQAQRLLSIMGQNNQTRDNRVSTLASIVGANNNAVGNAQQHSLAVRNAHDAEQQNTIATILGLGVDPNTGTLTPGAAKVLSKMTGIDPTALSGTSATVASHIIGDKISAASRNASTAEHKRHDVVMEGQGAQRVQQGAQRVQQGQERVARLDQPKAKTATPYEISQLIDKWHNGHPVNVHNGDGSVVTQAAGKLSYPEAYQQLRSIYHMDDVSARKALDTQYARGDSGRAWLTNEEQAALHRANRQAHVGFYEGHAFIAPSQLRALKAKGLTPPGEMVNGRYFIKPVH